eukprot:SAG11_NODE_22363_length_407_cov_1.058442_1_plen_26_part_10
MKGPAEVFCPVLRIRMFNTLLSCYYS